MAVAVCWQSFRPLNWRRTLVHEFFRQCYLIGIGSLSFILLSGTLIGLAMVVQFLYWLGLVGQSNLVGEIIVLVMIREIAPLLVALIIVGRSGSVNMVELAHARTNGQLRMLDAQGIDPFLFFIVPRSLATAISMFCLTVVFILTALLTGYLVGSFVDPSDTTLFEFLNEVLAAMGIGEYAIIVLKPLITGLFISLITSTAGLSVGGRARQVTDILPLGYVKSVLAVFLVSGTLTVLL
jgi:phospholipid/cholesterol/gamma-HCH transport system permease protein